MKTKALKALMILSVMGLYGCWVIRDTVVLSTAVVVGTAGLAGYTVYKGGEAVYKGGEAVVSKAGEVGSSATKSIQKKHDAVVVSRGTLKAKCKYTIAEIYPATRIALREAGFTDISGRQDALTGAVQARTAFNEVVTVKFELLSKERTTVEIRIGSGDLKKSEYLYDQILGAAAATKGRSQQ